MRHTRLMLVLLGCLVSADAQRKPRPGVATAGVRREMASITPLAVFETGGTPDWQVVTPDAIWVANGPKNTVHRLDPKTNTIAATVTVGEKPCAGLTVGFGSVWVPNCGSHTVSRVSLASNTVEATVPVGPSESEGLVAASGDAIWLVTDKAGKLSRIDPKTNAVAAEITIPANSAGVFYAEGGVWVTTPEKNMLTRVDAKTNKVTHSIEVGPGPRFLTYGAGSIWTLNQGDGTVSRVDATVRQGVGAGGSGGAGRWRGDLFRRGACVGDGVSDSVVGNRSGDEQGDAAVVRGRWGFGASGIWLDLVIELTGA